MTTQYAPSITTCDRCGKVLSDPSGHMELKIEVEAGHYPMVFRGMHEYDLCRSCYKVVLATLKPAKPKFSIFTGPWWFKQFLTKGRQPPSPPKTG